ncbi:MAG: hypothetical protein GC191_19905 [Azospirillum sp.]|nr:hypothetical protein [Azospirillum sp.]
MRQDSPSAATADPAEAPRSRSVGVPAVFLGLIAAGLGLGLFSYLAALLPWQIGIWADSEPIAAAVHAGAGAVALGLAGALWSRSEETWPAFSHPFVLLPLALAVWSLVSGLAARSPALNILGSPQTAEGVLLYLDFAIFVAGGILLGQRPRLAAITGLMALAAAIVIPMLTLWPATRVYFFGAWLTFGAVAAAVITLILLERRCPPWMLSLAGLAALVPGLALSDSNTAIGAGLLILPALWPGGSSNPKVQRWLPPRRMTIAIVVVPIVLIAVFQAIGQITPEHAFEQPRMVESLWSRARLQRALLAEFGQSPAAVLFGTGWGHIRDLFSRNLLAAEVPIWNTRWDMLGRDIVNSHSFVLEALLAAGLPALVLRLAMVASLPLACRPGRRLAAACFGLCLATLGSLWFQMPGTTAMVALAYAALAGASPRPAASRRTVWLAAGLLAGLGVALAAAAVGLFGRGLVEAELQHQYLPPDHPPPLVDCDSRRFAAPRGDVVLAELLGRHLKQIRTPGQTEPASEATLLAIANLICLSERPPYRQAPAPQSFVMALTGDIALAPAGYNYRRYFSGLIDSWPERLREFLTLAPGRSDLAVGYFTWATRNNRWNEVRTMAESLLARDPTDPVGLWYDGAALLRDPARVDAGYERLRQALAQGIDLRLNVSEFDRRNIANHRPALLRPSVIQTAPFQPAPPTASP